MIITMAMIITWFEMCPWSWMRGWASDSPLPASSSCGTHRAVLLRMVVMVMVRVMMIVMVMVMMMMTMMMLT